MPIISIIIPTYGDIAALYRNQTFIEEAIAALPGLDFEILLVATPHEGRWPDVEGILPALRGKIDVLRLEERGKFRALRRAASRAKGRVLIYMDADVRPSERLFQQLVLPILDGQAEVYQARPEFIVEKRVYWDRWSTLSAAAWHHLRIQHEEHRWAVSGYCFAIRTDWFPYSVRIPLLDDAAIGLSVRENGGRIGYCGNAVVWVQGPKTYRDWLSQKMRTRRGWHALERDYPREVKQLRKDLERARVKSQSNYLHFSLYTVHERWLSLMARVSNVTSPLPEYWDPIASTKRW